MEWRNGQKRAPVGRPAVHAPTRSVQRRRSQATRLWREPDRRSAPSVLSRDAGAARARVACHFATSAQNQQFYSTATRCVIFRRPFTLFHLMSPLIGDYYRAFFRLCAAARLCSLCHSLVCARKIQVCEINRYKWTVHNYCVNLLMASAGTRSLRRQQNRLSSSPRIPSAPCRRRFAVQRGKRRDRGEATGRRRGDARDRR